jgi:hypothetical protein
MPSAVFEPAIPETKRPQTYALGHLASVIGTFTYYLIIFFHRISHSLFMLWLLLCCIGGKFTTRLTIGLVLVGSMTCQRLIHYYTETEKQLRVTWSNCTFTVFCGCCDYFLDWITADLKMSSVRNTWEPSVCHLLMRGTDVFRIASSNTPLTAKSCACACIEFLAGTFSWSVDCTLSTAVNRLTSEANHLLASSDEVKNGFTFISTLPYRPMSSWLGVAATVPLRLNYQARELLHDQA